MSVLYWLSISAISRLTCLLSIPAETDLTQCNLEMAQLNRANFKVSSSFCFGKKKEHSSWYYLIPIALSFFGSLGRMLLWKRCTCLVLLCLRVSKTLKERTGQIHTYVRINRIIFAIILQQKELTLWQVLVQGRAWCALIEDIPLDYFLKWYFTFYSYFISEKDRTFSKVDAFHTRVGYRSLYSKGALIL